MRTWTTVQNQKTLAALGAVRAPVQRHVRGRREADGAGMHCVVRCASSVERCGCNESAGLKEEAAPRIISRGRLFALCAQRTTLYASRHVTARLTVARR